MKIDVDVDHLRESLLDRAGSAAGVGFPAAMLDVMERCFAGRYRDVWQPKLKEMIPSLGTELSNEPALYEEVWSWGTRVLGLDSPVRDAPAVTA